MFNPKFRQRAKSQIAAGAGPCRMSGQPLFVSGGRFITERAWLIQKAQRQNPRLADLNFDTMAGLEASPFQPVAGQSDFG